MSNDKQYYKQGVTPEKILAFVETKSGKSQPKTAKLLGVSQQTVSRWTGEIEAYIKSSPQYQEAAPKIAEMIPTALQVYANKLALDDLNAARDVLKMAVIFVERKMVESSDTKHSDDDLWNEFGGLVNAGTIGDVTTGRAAEGQGDNDNQGTETKAD